MRVSFGVKIWQKEALEQRWSRKVFGVQKRGFSQVYQIESVENLIYLNFLKRDQFIIFC